jgi:hypothetical protein
MKCLGETQMKLDNYAKEKKAVRTQAVWWCAGSLAALVAVTSCQKSRGRSETSGFGASVSALTAGTVKSDACKPYEAAALRYVNPTSATALQSALNGAQAGDLIELNDSTTYSSAMFLMDCAAHPSAVGTATNRIVLCGPSTAAVRGTDNSKDAALALENGCNYWTVDGFEVTGGNHAVVLKNASHDDVITGLNIHGTQGRALWLWSGAAGVYNNTIKANNFRDAGLNPLSTGWSIDVDGNPSSHDNMIVNNTFMPTHNTAIHLAGNSNTVSGNIIDQESGILDASAAAIGVSADGSSNTITGNVVTLDGLKSDGTIGNWPAFAAAGASNSFTSNSGNVNSTGLSFSLTGATPTMQFSDVGRMFRAGQLFSTTQGNNQWRYEYQSAGTYSDMSWVSADGKWEQPGQSTTWMDGNRIGPGPTVDASRAWVSPGTGVVRISGTVTRDEVGGDGVWVSIHQRHWDAVSSVWIDTVVFGPDMLDDSGPTLDASASNISVVSGDKLEFLVNAGPNSNDSADRVVWDPMVVYVTSNWSSCTPTTCAAQGANCDSISDGCLGTLSCGSCTSPQTCGGGGAANVCGCTALTCAAAGANCGSMSDGCGNTLDCGSCTSPQTCGGGGTANVCDTDSYAPSMPDGLTAGTITSGSAAFSWAASDDNVGTTGYNVYQDGTLLGSTSSTSFTATGLTTQTAYTFTVSAFDAVGNVSDLSGGLSVTTL